MEVPTLTIVCHEGSPPADDVFVHAACPASAGLDWATDPYTRIIWGIGYIKATYGTPEMAWAHELTIRRAEFRGARGEPAGRWE
jgi:hypothetical protein